MNYLNAKKEEHSMQKISNKEFVPSLSSANNYYTYQTHFLNLDFKKSVVAVSLEEPVPETITAIGSPMDGSAR